MNRKISAVVLCVLLVFALCGCTSEKSDSSSQETTLSDFPEFVEVPLIRQGTPYTCGIACLHSLLRWASYDQDVNDVNLIEACGTTEANGTSYKRILQYLQDTKLFNVSWNENMTADQLKTVINNGGVVMMPIQAWETRQTADGKTEAFSADDYKDWWSGGHWVIACGYNNDEVLFMDPATAGCYTDMSWADLEARWHDSPDYVSADQPFEKYEHCGFIVYRLNPEGYDSSIVEPLR